MAIIDTNGGRVLDVQVSGPAAGIPLVFHNSTPGSVVPYPAMQRSVHERGLRLVTFSRAGYGRSTRQPDRSVADAAADVAMILDHLDAPRCLTAGWSGGGPHALATAALMPDRVVAAASISGFAPYDAQGLDFLDGMGQGNLDEFARALEGETSLRASLEAAAEHMRSADGPALQEGIAPILEKVDRAFLTRAIADDLAAIVAEGLSNGADGWIDDDLAFVKPWGFSVADISVPVFLWQGGQDLMVPFAHGRWLAENIPAAVSELDPTQGHMALGLGDFAHVLDRLTSVPSGLR